MDSVRYKEASVFNNHEISLFIKGKKAREIQ